MVEIERGASEVPTRPSPQNQAQRPGDPADSPPPHPPRPRRRCCACAALAPPRPSRPAAISTPSRPASEGLGGPKTEAPTRPGLAPSRPHPGFAYS